MDELTDEENVKVESLRSLIGLNVSVEWNELLESVVFHAQLHSRTAISRDVLAATSDLVATGEWLSTKIRNDIMDLLYSARKEMGMDDSGQGTEQASAEDA